MNLSEVEVIRHYSTLSKLNFGVDFGFYPLGSCTMKYNPKINEDMAKLEGFTLLHPLQPVSTAQGALELMHNLEKMLCEICGFERFSLQPAAGANGELTGIMIIQAYFRKKRENRSKILVPDSAHGTNPASVSVCGFEAVEIKSDKDGNIDLGELKEKMTEDVAGIMITNPNTLGLFDQNILEVCKIVHEKGGLVYGDGANMNAMLGICKPKELGIDVMHLNLHKSFATPHGGGGPGSGPVGVIKELVEFLPIPLIEKKGEEYVFNYENENSIGKLRSFYGNFGVMVKAYTYLKAIGAEGIREVAEIAVLNANYLKEKLKKHYNLPFDRVCQHEFVLDDSKMPNGVTTNDIAKRLMDYGFHPPTVYFPLIVHGALMIEPTETETKETLDEFANAMIKIKEEAEKNPEIVKGAPHSTPVKRLDAVKAAREPNLRWKP
ncbi:MAG: glycine dehydrogenase (aminomethyl-transferring) [Candidatus Diapherotrites archaeon]|uniref:glycine dehydrogenase (aminomethyl-transferring) n=1 Tax=Candidatus Iainarchaeum sp. TaxID=3101447 RepID=A0A2D6M1B2_9ARCH|nr:glycine dehydrogenase (aminomethyl-transferring) [Candidatus Diapherotrites archaeon]